MQVSIRRYKERNKKLCSPEKQVFKRDSPRETLVSIWCFTIRANAVIGMKFNKKF